MPFDSKEFIEASVRNAEELAILDRLQEVIATPEQWVRGMFQDGHRYCAMGAWQIAVAGLVPWATPRKRTRHALESEARNLGWQCVAQFNDDPKTTHADILALIARTRRTLE